MDSEIDASFIHLRSQNKLQVKCLNPLREVGTDTSDQMKELFCLQMLFFPAMGVRSPMPSAFPYMMVRMENYFNQLAAQERLLAPVIVKQIIGVKDRALGQTDVSSNLSSDLYKRCCLQQILVYLSVSFPHLQNRYRSTLI